MPMPSWFLMYYRRTTRSSAAARRRPLFRCIITTTSSSHGKQPSGTHLAKPPPPPPAFHHSSLLSLLLRHPPGRRAFLQVHCHLLTNGFCRHNQVDQDAMRLWNTIIRHYSQDRFPQEAIRLYEQIRHLCFTADTFTFSFLLKSCANLSRPDAGAQFHCIVIEKGLALDVYVGTAVVDMYSACGCLGEAKRAFDEMPERNSVSWNAMITGFAGWGELVEARSLFDRMPDRNVISWTGLIDGYTRARRPEEALALFRRMLDERIRPTEITVLAVVPAISNLSSLGEAESLHAYCEKSGLSASDVRVGNSLIDMYAKCGSIRNSLRAFYEMDDRRNLVSWTTAISGLAMHGMATEVVALFEKMEKRNVRPNQVTFLSILNACSHGGLVEEGLRFFKSMVHDHGVEPEAKHYGCVIDLLGRAGRLREAEELIVGLPLEVNVVVWRTLLGCCSKHGDAEMAERVMRRVLTLEERYSGDYVVYSNVLTEVGRYDDAERVRRLMDDRSVLKVPGHSLIGGNH